MARLARKRVILAEIESTYGTDASPSGAANAILVAGDVNITPLDMKTVDRAIVQAFLGAPEKLPGSIFAKVDFAVELAGAGAAGDVPPYGPLLRGCAFSETVTADEKVVYAPVSEGMESLTLHVNRDGVLHRLLGARGSVKLNFAVDGIPTLNFSFTGLFVAVQDAAMPAATLTAWQKPLVVTKTNTPVCTLHGYALKLSSLSLDAGNSIATDSLLNSIDRVLVTDRGSSGSATFEATLLAEKDWWSTAATLASGALQVVHGTAAGNKVKVDAPAVQVMSPKYQDNKGHLMLIGDLILNPVSGNDELTITVF